MIFYILYLQPSFVLSDGRTVVGREERTNTKEERGNIKERSNTIGSVQFHHHHNSQAGGDHIDLADQSDFPCDDDDLGTSLCGWLLTALSFSMVVVTLPFSLCVCFKVVQEYERAVIFRLGRLLNGGSKGPG